MKPKIGLVGYFGWGNYGDELFVEAHKKNLSEDFDLEVVHDLLEAPYLSKQAIKNLESYDGFLIGGGDLINPNAISKLYWRRDYLKKPVFVYGIGVPNSKIKQSPALDYYREFFNHDNVKLTVLRDRESCQYFNSVIKPKNEALSYPDAVCSLEMPAAKSFDGKTIGFSIRSHHSVVGNYEQVREAVDTAKSLGYSVKLIVMSTGILGEKDYKVAKEFAKDDEEIIYSESLDDISSAIGGVDQLVSMKFHGMIVAAMYAVPSVQMSSTPKNRNFLRYLQRMELQSNYNSDDLYTRIPHYPAKIHSLLVRKLKRDSLEGYKRLRECMKETFN